MAHGPAWIGGMGGGMGGMGGGMGGMGAVWAVGRGMGGNGRRHGHVQHARDLLRNFLPEDSRRSR